MIESQSLRVLGLSVGASEAEIRRAYAQKLRVTNPEDNPEGFKELRAAYEHALMEARYAVEYGREEDEEAEAVVEAPAGEPSELKPDSHDARRDDPLDDDARWNRTAEPPPPLDPLLSPEEQAHADACNKLAAALQANAPPEELHAALDGVLKSPALALVDTYNRTESWLIQVLANTRPASHWLFDKAIAHFHWDKHVGDHRAWGPAAIVNLRERIPREKAANEFLARVKDKRHEFHRAWKETIQPPGKRGWLSRTWSLRNYTLVGRFLGYVDARAPLAVEGLDPEAVYWWRNRNRGGERWAIAALAFFQSFGLIGVVGVALLLIGFFADDMGLSPPSDVPQIAGEPPKSEKAKDMLAAISELANKRAKDIEAARPPATEPPPRMVLTEAGKRIEARNECDNAVKRIKADTDVARRVAAASAKSLCLRELGKAPDSLQLMQYLAIAELADANPAAAKERFAAILEASPNDPYALYGSGLAAVALDGSADKAALAEALKREPAVKAYFAGFGFIAPDVAPMEGEPKSRIKKRPVPKSDGELKEVASMDDDGVQELLKHFGLRRTPKGEATLYCLIKADGRMTNCLIAEEKPYNQGVGEFARPIVEAVKFEPMTLAGAPVDDLPISYTLTLGTGDAPADAPGKPAN